MKILILNTETFSGTGGIQSMSRCLAYILHQLCLKNKWRINLCVLNDNPTAVTKPHLPADCFSGSDGNKYLFTLKCIRKGLRADLIIVNHVNLSFPAIAIRLLNPGCKIWLTAHGNEVWHPLSGWKKTIWKIADHIICVSNFTRDKVIEIQGVNPNKCRVVNNIADPFIREPKNFSKPEHLLKRYQLNATDKIVITLARITPYDIDKGYDRVITALGHIRKSFPNVYYLLAGPIDLSEKLRLEAVAVQNGLTPNFRITGFIEKEELMDHFLLADLFVMPSKKEGFGIVFTEAMAGGLPVIAGNKDGSIDATGHSKSASLIDPDRSGSLEAAIKKALQQGLTAEFRKNIREESLKRFNEQEYGKILARLIRNEK